MAVQTTHTHTHTHESRDTEVRIVMKLHPLDEPSPWHAFQSDGVKMQLPIGGYRGGHSWKGFFRGARDNATAAPLKLKPVP